MRYIGRRLIHAVLLLLAVSFFSFALLQLAPGDFFDAMRLNPEISRQTVEKYSLGIRPRSAAADSLRTLAAFDVERQPGLSRWLRMALSLRCCACAHVTRSSYPARPHCSHGC